MEISWSCLFKLTCIVIHMTAIVSKQLYSIKQGSNWINVSMGTLGIFLFWWAIQRNTKLTIFSEKEKCIWQNQCREKPLRCPAVLIYHSIIGAFANRNGAVNMHRPFAPSSCYRWQAQAATCCSTQQGCRVWCQKEAGRLDKTSADMRTAGTGHIHRIHKSG